MPRLFTSTSVQSSNLLFFYPQGQNGHPGPSGLPGEPVSTLSLQFDVYHTFSLVYNVQHVKFLCRYPHLSTTKL